MTHINRKAALGFAAAVFAVSSVAETANAQAIKGQTYDEIVVTAQRSEENVQDVPIAVTAFSAENLEMQQIEAFSDLQFNTPNMTFTKGNFSGVNMTIRGVSSATVAASGDSGVSFHINEAPLPTRVFEIEYYDLQRVEVLRGPQGTLFGRNATGGVVNMVTAKPGPDFEADVELETAEYGHFKAKGMVNVPLSEKLALRVAGISLQRDGFTTNLFNGEDIDDRNIQSYRGTLSYELSEDTNAWIMYSSFEEDDKRARIGRQMCSPTSSIAFGCHPTEVSYGGGPGGASTLGGLYGAYNGLLPFDPTASSFTPISDPRAVIQPFTPVYKADEEMVMGGIEHEFVEEGLIVNLLAAHHETSVFSQQAYGNNNGMQKFIGGAIVPVSAYTPDSSGIFSGAVQGYYDYNFGYDTSSARSETDFYEARIRSSWEGQTNFLLGFNFTEAEAYTVYDVYANTLDSVGLMGLPSTSSAGLYPSHYRNETSPYNLETWAGFGEVYHDLRENLKATIGLRYTNTKKTVADNQTLFNAIALGGNGTVGTAPVGLCNLSEFQTSGTCLTPPIPAPGDSRIALGIPNSFEENEWTGRAGLDWFPEVEWSEQTMVYGFYSRGYRPGAFNPPVDPALFAGTPQTVDPEFVDSFEVGTKNVLHEGQLVANATAFYYDYQGLQISKIINRTSVNENIDAKIHGLEGEFVYTPNQWEGFQL
ncbi:MAG: TonB-dependent receptor, partial [Alphaproteobacteria bacterium]